MVEQGRFSKLEVGEATPQEKAQFEVPVEERGADYYRKLGRECFEEGDYEESLKYYSRVLEFERNDLAAWIEQVRCLLELDEAKEAHVWCNKALERFADNPELLAAEAVAYSRMGDFGLAMAYSDSSLEKEGSSPYVWVARGEVLMASRRKGSEYCFYKAVSENHKDWFIYFTIGRICMSYRKFSLAIDYFLSALELNSSNAFLYFQAGKCYQALGMRKKASFCYEQALVLRPDYTEAEIARIGLERKGFFARLFRKQ